MLRVAGKFDDCPSGPEILQVVNGCSVGTSSVKNQARALADQRPCFHQPGSRDVLDGFHAEVVRTSRKSLGSERRRSAWGFVRMTRL